MNVQTALNHLSDFKSRFGSILSMAEIGGYTHDWMLDEMQSRIYKQPQWDKLPRWARAEFHGHMTAIMQSLYHSRVVWRHIHNGIAFADWNECPEECKQAMRENRGDSAHVWAKHLPKIKRFSSAEKITAQPEVNQPANP